MTKSKAFLRNYKYEIVALLVDLLVVVFTYFTVSQFNVFLISLVVFAVSTFVVIYFKTKERDFYFFPFEKPGQKKDWVGRGDLKYFINQRCYEISNSHVGYILPKTFNWDDYKYEVDFKIANISFGFIVRAVNLSNYVMYQIFNNRIKPHLRINGKWIVLDEISFSNNLIEDNWYKLSVICEKRRVSIVIKNGNEIYFDRSLVIPDNITIEHKEINEEAEETEKIIRFNQDIDFDFGSVGFRNCSNERALLKNIFIEKL